MEVSLLCVYYSSSVFKILSLIFTDDSTPQSRNGFKSKKNSRSQVQKKKGQEESGSEAGSGNEYEEGPSDNIPSISSIMSSFGNQKRNFKRFVL